MPDAGCRMPDAGCRMPDAGCRMLDAGCWMPGKISEHPASIAFKKMKFRREPRRGDKIIAQGKRESAPPWVGGAKGYQAPEGRQKLGALLACFLSPLSGLGHIFRHAPQGGALSRLPWAIILSPLRGFSTHFFFLDAIASFSEESFMSRATP